MSKVQQKCDGSTTAMRWTARILALLAVGLFVLFAVELGSRVFPTLSWEPQGIPLMIALAVALVGVVVAWRWELVGGIMTVAGVAGIISLVCAGSGTDMLFCAFLFTLPLLVAGALYIGCCYRTRLAKVTQESKHSLAWLARMLLMDPGQHDSACEDSTGRSVLLCLVGRVFSALAWCR